MKHSIETEQLFQQVLDETPKALKLQTAGCALTVGTRKRVYVSTALLVRVPMWLKRATRPCAATLTRKRKLPPYGTANWKSAPPFARIAENPQVRASSATTADNRSVCSNAPTVALKCNKAPSSAVNVAIP